MCVSLATGEQDQQGGQQERSLVLHIPSSAYYADTVLHSNLYILPILVKLIENKQKFGVLGTRGAVLHHSAETVLCFRNQFLVSFSSCQSISSEEENLTMV